MAELQSALQTLAPCEFSSIPQDDLHSYLRSAFRDGQVLVDSVPFPPVTSDRSSRLRSNTSSSVLSNASDIVEPSTCSPSISSAQAALCSAWGKPLKLSAKDNPHGISVYKLGGKDGRGAWFARRSIHVGMDFSKWKRAMQQEFPETMKSRGGPGEGNIRGIGGERRVESMVVEGVGNLEVYHLSAQFPGPTAPRDFVTLLLTSDSALSDLTSESTDTGNSPASSSSEEHVKPPRHYMVISKPCYHPECPPREHYVRGEYESVEFIREIPLKRKAAPSTNLSSEEEIPEGASSTGNEAKIRNVRRSNSDPSNRDAKESNENTPEKLQSDPAEKRKRGNTVSLTESRGAEAKEEQVDTQTAMDEDEEPEPNPVEWIMITRSDPGGNVPRFMVERGTPASIVSDASKFVQWAVNAEPLLMESSTQYESGKGGDGADETPEDYTAAKANGHPIVSDNPSLNTHEEESSQSEAYHGKEKAEPLDSRPLSTTSGGGILSTVAGAISAYAPAAVINRWPGYLSAENGLDSETRGNLQDNEDTSDFALAQENALSRKSTVTSIGSFASAEEQLTDEQETSDSQSPTSGRVEKDRPGEQIENNIIQHHQKELAKLNERRIQLEEKMAKKREKDMKDHEELTSKESRNAKRSEEKHAREIKRQEEKFRREMEKLESKRAKEMRKVEEKQRKLQERDEKARLSHERDDLRAQLEVCMRERELFALQVAELQRENTILAARLGKFEGGGRDVLRGLQSDLSERSGDSAASSLKSEGRSRRFSLSSQGPRTSPQQTGTGSSKSLASASPTAAKRSNIPNAGENKNQDSSTNAGSSAHTLSRTNQ